METQPATFSIETQCVE